MKNQLINRASCLPALQPKEKKALESLLTSPQEYCKALQPKGINDVFSAPDLSIRQIQDEIGTLGAKSILVVLVGEVVSFFNVGKTMDPQQVALTCDLILESYPYMKLEDFKLCFRNGMKARYGRLYDRLDGSVILAWLACYEAERIDCATQTADRQRQPPATPPPGRNLYQDYLDNLATRAQAGDTQAIRYLADHRRLQALLQNSGYDQYARHREALRLAGRGPEYEKRYNRWLK